MRVLEHELHVTTLGEAAAVFLERVSVTRWVARDAATIERLITAMAPHDFDISSSSVSSPKRTASYGYEQEA